MVLISFPGIHLTMHLQREVQAPLLILALEEVFQVVLDPQKFDPFLLFLIRAFLPRPIDLPRFPRTHSMRSTMNAKRILPQVKLMPIRSISTHFDLFFFFACIFLNLSVIISIPLKDVIYIAFWLFRVNLWSDFNWPVSSRVEDFCS